MTILPGTQVLRMALPSYCMNDPTLARVVDEQHADDFLQQLDGRTVAQCLPQQPNELAFIGPEGTVLEIAALMARTRTPLVACRCLVSACSGARLAVGRLPPSPLPVRTVVMPSQKKRPVRLTRDDREFLERLTTTGVHPASMIRRARVLLALDTS